MNHETDSAGRAERSVLIAAGPMEGSLLPHNDFQVTGYLPVESHEILEVRMPRTSDPAPVCAGICFYNACRELLKGRGVTLYTGRSTGESFTETARIYLPKEAAFFRATCWSDAVLSTHEPALSFAYAFKAFSEDDRPFTAALPTCTEMNCVIKRARQLTDLRWKPRVNVPRYCLMDGDYSGQSDTHFLDFCLAGREYTGVPYSGAGEPDRNTKKINPETFCGKWGYYKFHVGIDVSFETFVTACRYPGSIFGERAQQTEPSFDSSPYGTYCSALVGYALGYRQPLPKVAEFCDSENFLKLTDCLPSYPAEDIRLCDILKNGAHHIAIITDLVRAADGRVSRIEVSEATTVGNGNNTVLYSGRGGLCRRKMWSADEFFSWFRSYALYRVISFQGIGYEKSEYVDVGHESGSMPVIDLPLIPYLGNRARYQKDHIVDDRILIGAAGFTQAVIEKDGKPFRTLPLTGQSFVHGGFTEEGTYTAYLTDGTRRTMSCTWTVEPFPD